MAACGEHRAEQRADGDDGQRNNEKLPACNVHHRGTPTLVSSFCAAPTLGGGSPWYLEARL